MKVTVKGMFVAEGTVAELAEFMARSIVLMKDFTEQLVRANIQKEIQNIWKNIKKEGDEP